MGQLSESLSNGSLRKSPRANQKPEVDRILDQVDDQDRAVLRAQLEDTSIPASAIAEWLQQFGHLTNLVNAPAAVQRWRRSNGLRSPGG